MSEERSQEFKVWRYNNNLVRTIQKEEKTWWITKDVCDVLDILDVSMAMSRLDDDEKLIQTVMVSGQKREVWTINESGLYSLIFTSRKPEAKVFKKWITSEVLPSIRKHGGYLTPAKIEEVLLNPDTIIRLATDLKNERQLRIAAETRAEEGQKTVLRLLPMAEYSQTVLLSDSLVKMNDIAVHLGISAIKLNKFLAGRNVIYRQGETWYPHSRYRDGGYFDFHVHHYTDMATGETKTKSLLKATEQGRKLIIEMWEAEKEKAS